MKRIVFFLLLSGIFSGMLPGVAPRVHAEPGVYPVQADGWIIAGNKTVGAVVRLMRIGLWDDAKDELRKMLGYRPGNHAAQYNLGVCYERLGDFETARKYYQKAMDIWPEAMYCEALARLDAFAGNGAEFVKFLIPCTSSCRTGFIYARSGMWRKARAHFEAALALNASAATALNLAIAAEVTGDRNAARSFLQRASALGSDPRHEAFSRYLATAPDLPLDMLTALPELTTVTSSTPAATMFICRHFAPVRLENSLDSPVLDLLSRNDRVDVIHFTSSWARVRTFRQKEGFLPSIFLADRPGAPDGSGGISGPWDTRPEPVQPEPAVEGVVLPVVEESPDRVRVQSAGKPVLVRREPSLIAETAGSLDDGTVIEIRECADGRWLEILSGTVTGFIMKQFTVPLEEGNSE